MTELRIVCTGRPGPRIDSLGEVEEPVAPYFIEVENDKGQSVNAGTWRERPDGLWELVIKREAM